MSKATGYCQCGNVSENRDTGDCASCASAKRKADRQAFKAPAVKKVVMPQKPIKKVADKMKAMITEYSAKKKEWIHGKRCAVFPTLMATDIHHICGKVGYIDDYARLHDIHAYLDDRYWLPVSRKGHVEIETHPNWARENGFTLSRLSRK